jgi:hypothetical protein
MGRYYDEATMGEIRQAFETDVLAWAGVTTSKMFGCPCYRANGSMFAVILTGSLVLTELPPEVRGALPPELGATAFTAGPRKIEKWAQIPVGKSADLEPLMSYAELSYRRALEGED